tara:strand:+ start:318 stop:575 length:258 start_codon:yes stop_codon:yes gene_type:complete
MKMEEARELLLKHLYLQGGDGLGISDGRVYNACLDAIMEALTIPDVSPQREMLEDFLDEYIEAWEDGMAGSSSLLHDAKKLKGLL